MHEKNQAVLARGIEPDFCRRGAERVAGEVSVKQAQQDAGFAAAERRRALPPLAQILRGLVGEGLRLRFQLVEECEPRAPRHLGWIA